MNGGMRTSLCSYIFNCFLPDEQFNCNSNCCNDVFSLTAPSISERLGSWLVVSFPFLLSYYLLLSPTCSMLGFNSI